MGKGPLNRRDRCGLARWSGEIPAVVGCIGLGLLGMWGSGTLGCDPAGLAAAPVLPGFLMRWLAAWHPRQSHLRVGIPTVLIAGVLLAISSAVVVIQDSPEPSDPHTYFPWLVPAGILLLTGVTIYFLLLVGRYAGELERARGHLEAALGEAEAARREAELLDGITEKVNSGVGLNEILDYVYESFHALIPYDRLGFAVIEADPPAVRYCWARSDAGLARLPNRQAMKLAGTRLEAIVSGRKPRIVNDLTGHLRESPDSAISRLNLEEGMRSSLTCPLVANGHPVGFLFFNSRRPGAYQQGHARIFMRVADKISTTLEKARLYEDLAGKNARLEQEVARRHQAEQALSLVIERPGARFQAGGTLHVGAGCYVERRADRELCEALLQGEFCYVLTSRQMGKSSLMVRTAQRLKEREAGAILLDLTAVGENVTADQWYFGLACRMGWQTRTEDAIEDYWERHLHLSPVQRLFSVVREVVLPSLPSRVVIFIDELDTVRSLPFSTNEFFAAIRECHNRRAEDPELERVTCCLLGTVVPGDLIADRDKTPFNVGRRVVLRDFTPAEAAPLAKGLGRGSHAGEEMLGRILHWTGGHPYLTLRLCKALTEEPEVQTTHGVDDLCDGLFLSARVADEDPNLAFLRDRLLRSEHAAELLRLYQAVRSGQEINLEEEETMVSRLEMTGLVRVEGGRLVPRNRIYEHVFNPGWIRRHLHTLEEPPLVEPTQGGLVVNIG